MLARRTTCSVCGIDVLEEPSYRGGRVLLYRVDSPGEPHYCQIDDVAARLDRDRALYVARTPFAEPVQQANVPSMDLPAAESSALGGFEV